LLSVDWDQPRDGLPWQERVLSPGAVVGAKNVTAASTRLRQPPISWLCSRTHGMWAHKVRTICAHTSACVSRAYQRLFDLPRC